jgi:asparagine synthetase B (glutamine-hydrolysing)
MCSFLFYLLSNDENIILPEVINHANQFMKQRGPDATNVVHDNAHDGTRALMLHNLLHITGREPTQQPVVHFSKEENDGPIYVLFNGEIYNYKDIHPEAESDTDCIVHAYLKYGPNFARHLDGEFAIVVYDPANQLLVVTVDAFMTKPLYVAHRDGGIVGVATYASCLERLSLEKEGGRVEMFRPNTTVVYNTTSTKQVARELSRARVRDFDAGNQHKTETTDWEAAFLRAVRKRASHGMSTEGNENEKKMPFLTMSSGYDSGAIALALNLLGLPYATFSTHQNEDLDVLARRVEINYKTKMCSEAVQVSQITDAERHAEVAKLQTFVEPFRFVHEDAPGTRLHLWEDGGAVAACYGCRLMSDLGGYRVMLSGSGADEILSDYGFRGRKWYHHSQFGGLFPEDLLKDDFFPWRKFYDDTQRSYLFKDEIVAGAHGIEGRYPFLDPEVVQEFLWLRPEVKNGRYKAVVHDFLTRHGYPFKANTKTGFAI